MAYWLVKSEPSVWSWQDQVRVGTSFWDGVRNFQAANNLKAMRAGDLAFFYHSNEGKEIVGIVEIVREAYPDTSDASGRFVGVDVRVVRAFEKPVSLAAIKLHPDLQDIPLIRQSRLSVMPLLPEHWSTIIALSTNE